MSFNVLIWKHSVHFSQRFLCAVPIKKVLVRLFLTVYFLHPGRNKGNDPFSFLSLSFTGTLFLAEDGGMARSWPLLVEEAAVPELRGNLLPTIAEEDVV